MLGKCRSILCSAQKGGQALGHDIDAAYDAHALDGGEVAGMLVGHASGAKDEQTHMDRS